MLSTLNSVRALLLAIFIFMLGSGSLATLVGVRLDAAGSGVLAAGIAATAYFSGLILGSLRAAPLVIQFGHARAMAGFVGVLASSTLAYGMVQHLLFWSVLRAIDGVCVAGVFVCLESWLNERAEPATRGTVLAGYMIALYAGQALGQFLLGLGYSQAGLPFIAASLIISFTLVPVMFTRDAAQVPGSHAPLPVRDLLAISPLGAVGAVATGLMLGAFYALGAIHARRLGMDLSATASFMSVVILGGVLLQWPLGRLSDRFDRRCVIVAVFAATAAISLAIATIRVPGLILLVLGAAFGGTAFALYPLSVAHTNDHLRAGQRIAASGGLVLLYAIGAAAGPMAGAAAMRLLGAGGLFELIGLVAGTAFAFGVWRQWSTMPVPRALQQIYQMRPRTTPMSAALAPVAPREETDR